MPPRSDNTWIAVEQNVIGHLEWSISGLWNILEIINSERRFEKNYVSNLVISTVHSHGLAQTLKRALMRKFWVSYIYTRLKELMHCGLMSSYGEKDLGQHRLRKWLVAWWYQAMTFTNIDFSLVRFCGIHVVGFCGIHVRAVSWFPSY